MALIHMQFHTLYFSQPQKRPCIFFQLHQLLSYVLAVVPLIQHLIILIFNKKSKILVQLWMQLQVIITFYEIVDIY